MAQDIIDSSKRQSESQVQKNVIKVYDTGALCCGVGFFARKEYCITSYHAITNIHEIYVEINNKKAPAYYEKSFSDPTCDIAVLRIRGVQVAPLVLAKESMPGLPVFICGFRKDGDKSFSSVLLRRTLRKSLTKIRHTISKPTVDDVTINLEAYKIAFIGDKICNGSPACYLHSGKVIGMVSQADLENYYIIPIETILRKFERSDVSYSSADISFFFLENARRLAAMGLFQEAISNYNRIINYPKDHNYRDALLEKGEILLEDFRKYNQAIRCFDKVISVDNLNPKAWFFKALTYSRMKRYDKAIEYYQKAIDCYQEAIHIDSYFVKSILNIGYIYASLERYQDAIKYFDRALEADSEKVDSWYNKGICLFNLQRYAEAVPCFERTIQLNPSDFEARSKLSQSTYLATKTKLNEFRSKSIEDLLSEEESDILEFKSSMLFDKTKNRCAENDYLKLEIVRTIVAFLNSKGGVLIIGIDPNKVVIGLENDYTCIKNKRNWDTWQQLLINELESSIDRNFMRLIDILPYEKDKHTVATVYVNSSPEPIWIKNKKENNKKDFYVRIGNTTSPLDPEQSVKYIRDNWNRRR